MTEPKNTSQNGDTPAEDITEDAETAPGDSGEHTEVPNVQLDTDADAEGWEWWTRIALVLAAVMVVLWVLVFAKIGTTSVTIHAMVIPTVGRLTLPLLAWGLLRTLFRPPALRRSRTIAFFTLLAVSYAGNVPFMAVPLETSDWQSDTRYLLPFDGEWTTLAGGDDRARNYHATTAAVRWGYDFIPLVDGKKFRLDGAKSEDFYCFGRDVYAPAAGRVVRATDGVVDNAPNEIASDSFFGNYVVIEVDDDEYVYISHMQKDSIQVKTGEQVNLTTVIGKCGNSGRTVEPHVHVHAQDRVDFPIAMGLPIEFSGYEADGERVERGMPIGATEWETFDGQSVKNVAERNP